MTTEMWLPGRTVVKTDAVLLAAAHQRLGVKLLGIVDMRISAQCRVTPAPGTALARARVVDP